MIRVQHKLPKSFYLGFSGGLDSTVALDFLARNHDVTLVWVDHGDATADWEFVTASETARKYNIGLIIRNVAPTKPLGVSQEEHWRNCRYEVFHSLPREVVTCHHLDDCVETYVWNMCNGRDQTIPYRNKNVIRPFRLTEKREFLRWAEKNKLSWFEDPTNADAEFAVRNHIRHSVIPEMLKVNPGLARIVYKRILNEKVTCE